MNKKIKIAFIKFQGVTAGGTEKFLQIIAANLPKDKFEVDYFYCDLTKTYFSDIKYPETDQNRLNYLLNNNVNLIKFKVGARDLSTYSHKWLDTNFWELFKPEKYDIIQTGRSGRMEYPFNKIKNIPIVDSIHLNAGVDNQYNISRVMHICQWNADRWIKKGGDKKRVVIVSHPITMSKTNESFRQELGVTKKFIYGFHQRNDDNIFSPIPLNAFKKISNDTNHFILLGGGEKYKQQAKELGIINITFLTHNSDPNYIYKFLNTLDVYAHGRKDGEVNSTAMAEAMFYGLPIISHWSEINNGHIECIGEAGLVVKTVDEYVNEMKKLATDKEYLLMRQIKAKERFLEKYELSGQMKNIENIYLDVIKNPFPNKIRRFFYQFHYIQTIRPVLGTIYFLFKFKKYKKIFNAHSTH